MSHYEPKTRGLIAWMANNSVASNLLMISLVLGGLLMGSQIQQEVFPKFDLDIVTVRVPYPGASPQEVEQGIILAVEEAVDSLDGVKEITSTASEGLAFIQIELEEGSERQKAVQDIKNAVDRLRTLPENAEEPVTSLVEREETILDLLIHGEDVSDHDLRNEAERLRDRLLEEKTITRVDLVAVKSYEIAIEVEMEKLRAYDLTLAQIAREVKAASSEIPGGSLKTKDGELLVRVYERKNFGAEFGDITIINNHGTEIKLRDIAVIKDGFEESDTEASFEGQNAVQLKVRRVGDQRPVEISDATRAIVESYREGLGANMDIFIWKDRSEIFNQRMHLLIRNGVMGLVLVLVLLGLFLEIKLAFWVTMGIPVSFMGALILLPSVDLTINMVSMFAFLISLGIVVDDAIVVGENVYDWRDKTDSYSEAAIQGAREVSLPVFFSVFTNIIAFIPLLFVPGTSGKIFRNIPLVVIAVFLISLVESLLVLPNHLSHKSKNPNIIFRGIHKVQQRFSSWVKRMIHRVYLPFLKKVIYYRYITVAIALGVLVICIAFLQSGRMGMTAMPRTESDQAVVELTMPYGTPIEQTRLYEEQLLLAAKRVVKKHGGKTMAKGIYTKIEDAYRCEISVRLSDPDIRPISTAVFVEEWRQETGVLIGQESVSFRSDKGGPHSGPPVAIKLSHKDVEILALASADLAESFSAFSSVKDVNDGFLPGKVQYDFKLLPAGRRFGLTPDELARQVRHAFYGAEALRQQRGRDEMKVLVKLPEDERRSQSDIESFMIRTPEGTFVPLMEVAELKKGRSYTEINRTEGKRTVTVTADVIPRSQSSLIKKDFEEKLFPELVAKYPGLSFSHGGGSKDLVDSLGVLIIGFSCSLFIIFAMLAISFRSYLQPLIILLAIPFGIVGAIIGHYIMGYSLSVISMMGLVALSGVVVNDSLVLIDFVNRERKHGVEVFEAVCRGSVRRFRPILLTSLTTFCGLAPMIFETSRQARFMIPMAISLGFGILFATVIALLIVPSLYLMIEDIKKVFNWIWSDSSSN